VIIANRRLAATRSGALCLALGLFLPLAHAAPPAPPTELVVKDVPNDAGTALLIQWELSPDDQPGADPPLVLNYRLEREEAPVLDPGLYVLWLRQWRSWFGSPPEKAPSPLATIPAGTKEFVDDGCDPGTEYVYSLSAVGPNESSAALVAGPIAPSVSWFNQDWKKLLLFATTVLVCAGMVVSTELAKRGKPVYIRPIAGLMAIEEAVGRATEMGRPMVYVPGIMDLNEIQTVAGVTVLSHVAKTAAQYDMQLEVPTSRSLVMTAARDAVQAGCLTAGRAEVYEPDRIYYVTDDQFSYVAHVCGRMLREKPAACFYIGQFFAESLLLAETGNSIGAIQLAGTAESSQMPFFVAACDYTLLGEEMFAASAYLSREPEELGLLRGQDIAKLIGGIVIVGGCFWVTIRLIGTVLGTV
jgi:hypothetical protein